MVVIAGCSAAPESVVPTRAVLPTLPPTATVAPTPTPIPLSLADFTVRVWLEGDVTRLAADTRTTLVVHAEINAPPDFPSDDLTLFFGASGGGGFAQTSVPLTAGRADAIYTSGESGGESAVRITATVDIPQLGRISAETLLTLVRQTLGIEFSQPSYATPTAEQGVPITFMLRGTPDDLIGQYGVAGSVEGEGSVQFVSGQSIGDQAQTVLDTNDSIAIYFRPPTGVLTGSSQVCVAILERSIQAPVCVLVVWGEPSSSLDVRWQNDVFWTMRGDNPAEVPEVRVQARADSGTLTRTVVAACYRVFAPSLDPPPVYLENIQTRDPLPNSGCLPIPLDGAGYAYNGFRPYRGAWVVAWSLLTDGLSEAVTHTQIIAAQPLRVTDWNAEIRVGEARLQLNAEFVDSTWVVYAAERLTRNQTMTQILIPLFIRGINLDYLSYSGVEYESNIDLVSEAVTSLSILTETSSNLDVRGDAGLPVVYIDPQPIIADSMDGEVWYRVFVYASIPNTALGSF